MTQRYTPKFRVTKFPGDKCADWTKDGQFMGNGWDTLAEAESAKARIHDSFVSAFCCGWITEVPELHIERF